MKIVVLTGGQGREAMFSNMCGKQVAEALEACEHKVVTLQVGEELATSLRQEKPDMCVIAMPGVAGANGEIQSLLEFLDIPFVGSKSGVCRKAADKGAIADVFETCHQMTEDELTATAPIGFTITCAAFEAMGAKACCDMFADRIPGGYPICVKPSQGAFAKNVCKVENQEQLVEAMTKILAEEPSVVVQQWIDGVEVSVSMLGEGWEAFTLPPVEIVADGWFSEAAREKGVQLVCPVRGASLSPDETMAEAIRSEIERAAFEAYYAYGLTDYGRIDLIWDGAQARVIDVEVAPDMSKGSLFNTALNAAQLTMKNVLNAMVGGLQY